MCVIVPVGRWLVVAGWAGWLLAAGWLGILVLVDGRARYGGVGWMVWSCMVGGTAVEGQVVV